MVRVQRTIRQMMIARMSSTESRDFWRMTGPQQSRSYVPTQRRILVSMAATTPLPPCSHQVDMSKGPVDTAHSELKAVSVLSVLHVTEFCAPVTH